MKNLIGFERRKTIKVQNLSFLYHCAFLKKRLTIFPTSLVCITDEQSFIKARIIVRSVLASIIVQWDSYHEQQARNLPKLLEITLRILNVLNKVLSSVSNSILPTMLPTLFKIGSKSDV